MQDNDWKQAHTVRMLETQGLKDQKEYFTRGKMIALNTRRVRNVRRLLGCNVRKTMDGQGAKYNGGRGTCILYIGGEEGKVEREENCTSEVRRRAVGLRCKENHESDTRGGHKK